MNNKTYKSISEVSELLKIKKHVIRYWDSNFEGISTRLGNKKMRIFNLKNIQNLHELKNILYKDGKSCYSLELAKKFSKSFILSCTDTSILFFLKNNIDNLLGIFFILFPLLISTPFTKQYKAYMPN